MGDVMGDYPVVLQQDLVWGDMDAFRHINNTVYFRYFENARIAYFEKAGIIAYMEQNQVGPILASTRCDFRAPLAFPGKIRIGASAGQIREKRFTMKYMVYSDTLSTIAAEGEGLIVYYDYRQGKSCPIPEAILASIAGIESTTRHAKS
jgi:acyl-CoA thioester hydrolase